MLQVPHLTGHGLGAVTGDDLEGDAASHLPLCGQEQSVTKLCIEWRREWSRAATHQHLLELLYRLVGHADAVNLPDLVSYVQSP